jgi:fibronectin-binding autotransporter adhesin
VLAGDSSGYVADTHVAHGTLAVDGAWGGNVDVAAAARLEGVGRVGGIANAGVVAPGRAGFGTLTVTGNYVGNGGTLEIETALGDDASPTDRLVVNGATSGTTGVTLINRNGLGAQTAEGIKIIDVVGASNGTFTLNGDYQFQGAPAVVAGAYAYRLYKNGVTDPNDGDWYLRSALTNPPTDPNSGEPPVTPPHYQPCVPVYDG